MLSLHEPYATLASADQVVLTIDNQKNDQRGATINHYKTPGHALDPVQCLARHVKHILAHNMPLSTPLSYLSPGTHVTAPHILAAIRRAAVLSGLPSKGYTLKRIGAHSLRASGAMALRLNGFEAVEIMKSGRWRGATFLSYIHSQIAALNRGVSTRMTRRIDFLNIGA